MWMLGALVASPLNARGDPMQPLSPYSHDDRLRWRKLLLAKGGEVSKKLEDLLAGKDVKLSEIELRMTADEKEPKEKRLRRFLDLLMARLKVVDHPRFGFDMDTGAFLPVPVLDEMPWIEVEPK